MDVNFIDTTFRDGHQSLWALGMRTGMIEAVAESMDQAGFEAMEVPAAPLNFKKLVRDLKEDPWDMVRMIGKKIRNTVKACSISAGFHPFEAAPPRSIVIYFLKHLVETGAIDRVQLTCNTFGQIKRDFPWAIPVFKGLGVRIALAVAYTISPRHTDEYYAHKIREILPFKPDAIYLKDAGGLLTVDRVRTLLPVFQQNANGVPVALHSHCTTGLAPLVYLEALQLGMRTLYTAVPPLANGTSQPSVFNVAANARLMGYATRVDEKILRSVSERLTAIAKQEKLPIGAPLEYDYAQYIHQFPGGVISNLKHQLAELRIQHRLDEVLEESVQVRKDLGYPIMITPHSQFVGTQAAINVLMGERYKVVIDELILFAQGVYGEEDSGCTWMDQNLKDKLLGMPRAKELEAWNAEHARDMPVAEIRDKMGANGVSDDEFLLRYIMKGTKEIEAMRAAGRAKRYLSGAMPLATLIQQLSMHQKIRTVQVQRGRESIRLQNGSSA